MGCPTRPSNVRVYQFRQPPCCGPSILPTQSVGRHRSADQSPRLKIPAITRLNFLDRLLNFARSDEHVGGLG
jgi:hypothetical protein